MDLFYGLAVVAVDVLVRFLVLAAFLDRLVLFLGPIQFDPPLLLPALSQEGSN